MRYASRKGRAVIMEWVLVKERLPMDRDKVLVFDPSTKRIEMSIYGRGKWWQICGVNCCEMHGKLIYAWCPLEPPEIDEEELDLIMEDLDDD